MKIETVQFVDIRGVAITMPAFTDVRREYWQPPVIFIDIRK